MILKRFFIFSIILLLATVLGINPVTAQNTRKTAKTAKKQSSSVYALQTVRFEETSLAGNRKARKQKHENISAYPCQEADATMILIPRGHLSMGNETTDSLWGFNAPFKHISVEDFMIDRTEVTNEMYHAFVQSVIDSIIAQRLDNPAYEYNINKVRESLLSVDPITGRRQLNTALLNYRFQLYNYTDAIRISTLAKHDSTVVITKDTAYIAADGTIVNETITRRYTGTYDFLNTYIINVYPDTTCWVMDFPEADNEMYARYYYSHPDYRHYPVVGISWLQANAYCYWRTEQQRKLMGASYGDTQPFRLPTEAEWEYAARAGSTQLFPWRDANRQGTGRYYANFMPDEGNYADDGNIITAHVATYLPNAYGLYDMAGNAAEWCSTAYTATGVHTMSNVNPQHNDTGRTLKTVRGGSWKDSERFVQSSWRTAEQRTTQRSWIGFRCAQSLATTSSGKKVLMKAQKSNRK